MIVEGKGCVAPDPVIVRCSKSLVDLCLAKAVERESFHGYRYSSSSYKRGLAGSFNFAGVQIEKSVSAVFAGILGEYVVSEWLRSNRYDCTVPDVSLRSIGDSGFDLICRSKTIDVKTRIGVRRFGEKDTWEVTRVTGRKKLKSVLTCDAYIFCTLVTRPTMVKKKSGMSSVKTISSDVSQGLLFDSHEFNRVSRNPSSAVHEDVVLINGWMYASQIADGYSCKFRKSSVGDNFNVSVQHRDIRGINDLIDYLEFSGEYDVD